MSGLAFRALHRHIMAGGHRRFPIVMAPLQSCYKLDGVTPSSHTDTTSRDYLHIELSRTIQQGSSVQLPYDLFKSFLPACLSKIVFMKRTRDRMHSWAALSRNRPPLSFNANSVLLAVKLLRSFLVTTAAGGRG